jgi:hypothetical protein
MSVGAMTAGDFKPCALCGRGVMHAGVPIFYRVRIESMGINLQEVQRTAGMEQFMGGHVALARVFHDPDIATPIALGNPFAASDKCLERIKAKLERKT